MKINYETLGFIGIIIFLTFGLIFIILAFVILEKSLNGTLNPNGFIEQLTIYTSWITMIGVGICIFGYVKAEASNTH